jgi:hypothetical protein
MSFSDEMRPIPGWEGLYSVTADGQVWSHSRAVTAGKRKWMQGGRWLIQSLDPQGYPQVGLHRDGSQKSFKVHRLVALAWLPPPTGGREHINHKDSIRSNNRWTNLEWCTPAENNVHGWRIGGRVQTQAQRDAFNHCHEVRRAFSFEQVSAIRARVAAGEMQKSIALEFGVAKSTICHIVKGRNYQPITGERHGV